MNQPLFVLAVLAANVVVSEWLVRHTPLRHLGSALLVIVLTAVTANTGVIPPYSDEVPLYGGIFDYLAPLGIFWLLLQVRLGSLAQVGAPMLVLFLVGALGTVAGVVLGILAVGGAEAFGPLSFAVAGMFTGTYVGGSVNFNAVAFEYGVVKDGALYAGAAVVDSAMTTIWMVVNVAVPRLFGRLWKGARRGTTVGGARGPLTGEAEDTETVHPMDLGMVLALGAGGVWGSGQIAALILERTGRDIPEMLILTTLALVLAQVPAVARLRGTRMVGMFSIMLFLAVIGALCDVEALRGMGALGVDLSIFVCIVVAVHGLVVYGASLALRIDPNVASVASQTNIGGGTTALALARSLGRADLVLPAILLGSVGTALGTYLGFVVAEWLQ